MREVTATARTVDADHGRIETRTATVSTDIAWLIEEHRWPGLTAVGKVERTREIEGKTTFETAYYLLSAPLTPERLNEVARSHWGVANGPVGTKPTSPGYWPYSEMRLPWGATAFKNITRKA